MSQDTSGMARFYKPFWPPALMQQALAAILKIVFGIMLAQCSAMRCRFRANLLFR
jgi:hypothetical protein